MTAFQKLERKLRDAGFVQVKTTGHGTCWVKTDVSVVVLHKGNASSEEHVKRAIIKAERKAKK